MTNTTAHISIDTNIVIRLFINDIPTQSDAARRCLEQSQSVSIADPALIETIFVLGRHYRLDRSDVVKYVQRLLTHPKINCNRMLFNKVLPMYIEHPALSIEDCCLAVYARLNNAAPLMTFDKKLATQLQHTELLKSS